MYKDENKERDSEDKKGIFFGIIGVLTLIVAIIGASFAYFSINATSRKDAVTVNAASVQIVYEEGQNIEIKDLIPASQSVASEALRRYLDEESGDDMQPYQLCKDDNKRTVCGVYDFTLTNNGDAAVEVTAKVDPTPLAQGPEPAKEKGFQNLKFVMYDITENEKTGSQLYTGTFTYEKFGLFGSGGEETQRIDGSGTTKKYRLFIWLDEAEEANNEEQGAVFKGTVNIDVVGAENGNITGTIKGH